MCSEIVEEKLISDLQLLRENDQRFYCFYMRDASLVDAEWFTENIKKVLPKKKISFYFCIRGIFVISPVIASGDFKKIRALIAHKLNKDEKKISGLFEMYDANDDWHVIIKIAKDELKNKRMDMKDNEHKDKLLRRKQRTEEVISGTIDKETLPDFDQIRDFRHQKIVLIVEDESFSATLLKTLIGKGYGAVVANTGYEAINQYMQQSPDLVFLDIELPDINGIDVLSKLKSIDKNVNVVVVTAHGTTENIAKAMKHRVTGCVSKPVSRQKIMQYLK